MGRFESHGALKRDRRTTKRHNAAVQRQKKLNIAYAILAALLPGDNIHHVAPSNCEQFFSPTRDDAIAAAEAKRQRKLAKRAKT